MEIKIEDQRTRSGIIQYHRWQNVLQKFAKTLKQPAQMSGSRISLITGDVGNSHKTQASNKKKTQSQQNTNKKL